MDVAEIRKVLAIPEAVKSNAFEVLSAITGLVNHKKTHNIGRELVIRALAVQEVFPTDYRYLLDALVRAVGLLPYANEKVNSSLEDRVLIEAHRVPSINSKMMFHTLQLQVYRDLIAGRNVILSATTSVGKSLVVDAVIASGKFPNVAIIVPTIALIDETRRRLSKMFGATHDIVTHPSQKPEFKNPTVFVLTQERALARKDLDRIQFFVIDEFYKLDLRKEDQERSIDLNLCFYKLASIGAQFYLIGPHISAVDGLALKYKHVFIPSHFSTVALDIEHFGLSKSEDERKKKLIDLCKGLTSPTLVYCQSPSKAAEAARALIEANFLPQNNETSMAVDWLKREFPEEWILIKALQYGVGIHHGNVPRAIQQYIVRAFEAGQIGIIVCTSTIIEGVNTVAENVIIYDKRINTSNIDYFTYRNIAGRAGRMRKYFIGKVFVLEEPPQEEDFSVQVAVEQQDENTPLSLIIDLPEDALAPISKERMKKLTIESPLSLETLRANRYISPEVQYNIYWEINRDLLAYEDALLWGGMPKPHQLGAVCELIYRFIDQGRTLKGYGIFSGVALKAEIDRLRMVKKYRDFIDHWVARRREEDTVSDAVERALRFMRKYVGYTLPRQIAAIGNIQADIFKKRGYDKVGDYSLFASKVESLFIDAGLFALDEYGIPPETARRLTRGDTNVITLNDALKLVLIADATALGLHPFEVSMLEEVKSTLPRAPSALTQT